MKNDTLFDKYKAIEKVGLDIEVPYQVMRFTIPTSRKLTLFGDQLCIGDNDSDYGSLEECRAAIAWFVTQLGGTVKWNKK